MPVAIKVSGDPRRPAEIVPYVMPVKNAGEPTGDLLIIFALLVGMAGLLLKIPICSWISLLCCLASIANTESAALDIKQIISSLSFAVFGIFSSFLNVPPPPLSKQP